MPRSWTIVLLAMLTIASSGPASALIAGQDFNALDASATFTTDSLPSGSALTNASSSAMSAGTSIGFLTVWVDTRGESVGPVTASSDSSDFIGANAFTGNNAPDVGPDGTTVASGVEQNFQFNDGDGRLELRFDGVDLSMASNRRLSLNYWIAPTSYESDDAFEVLLTDGTNTVSLLLLGETELEAQSSADDGSANWQTLDVSIEDALLSVDPTNVQLIVAGDTNSSSENLFIDNVAFASGVTEPPAAPLVINEIMQNPSVVSDSDGEWFEIFNPGGTAVDLMGWTVRDDGSDSFTIDASLIVPAGGFAVLGINADMSSNGGVAIDFAYGTGFFLSNSADELELVDPSDNIVDRVAWDGGPSFPDPNGASMALLDPALDNNAGSNWFTSDTPFGDGDDGTPGAANGMPITAPPAIVINEIMQNPSMVSDADGEWFEVFNSGDTDVDLMGWTVRDDGGSSFTIDAPLSLPAGGFAVLGINADMSTNGGVVVDFAYGAGFFLSNGADELELVDPSNTVVDRVAWDGGPSFPDPTGASMALLDPALDNNVGGNWFTSDTPFGDGDSGTPGADNGMPVVMPTLISAIQGTGDTSPLVGNSVVIEGIVVGDFQDGGIGSDGDLNGFFVQEEDADADADAATSEGIFVFDGFSPAVDVNKGDRVRVAGTVAEFFGSTQLSGVTVEIIHSGVAGEASPAALVAPFADTILNSDGDLIANLEAYEGMLVHFSQTLFVTEYFNLDRFGEIRLAADGREFQFTNSMMPDVAGFTAHQDRIARTVVRLDDGLTTQNPDPIRFPSPGLDTDNSIRAGDGITGLQGVVRYSRGSGGSGDEDYRITPTVEPVFETLNPRPAPPVVTGDLMVASLNVLNFFTTIDASGSACFPSNTRNDCRGADSTTEYDRQLAKLVTALEAIDADIIGLIELENNYTETTESPAELAAALNASGGSSCSNYGWVDPGQRVGGDAIAVGILYCTDSVAMTPGTTPAILTDADLPGLGLGDLAPVFDGFATSRAPLAATFSPVADEAMLGVPAAFTLVVNHYKSKGASGLSDSDSICATDPGADLNCDQGDGQGYWNARRTDASNALAAWLQTGPTGSDDPDVLIVGDLNAYPQEDPVQALIDDGYVDLLLGGEQPYTFVFDGQAGVLDYALANESLAGQVMGAEEWHINADEPDALDYNLDFGRPPAIFDGASPARASDHDPVIIGINLEAPIAPTVANAVLLFEESLANGSIAGSGKNAGVAANRLARFEALLARAASQEARGKRQLGNSLVKLINRTDGEPKPSDWIQGDGVADLNALLIEVLSAQ